MSCPSWTEHCCLEEGWKFAKVLRLKRDDSRDFPWCSILPPHELGALVDDHSFVH